MITSVILIGHIYTSPPRSSQSCPSPPVHGAEKGTAIWQRQIRNLHPYCPDTPLSAEQAGHGGISSYPVFPGQEESAEVRHNPQPTPAWSGLTSPPSPCPTRYPHAASGSCPALSHEHRPRREGPVLQQRCPLHTPLGDPAPLAETHFPILQHHLAASGRKAPFADSSTERWT